MQWSNVQVNKTKFMMTAEAHLVVFVLVENKYLTYAIPHQSMIKS